MEHEPFVFADASVASEHRCRAIDETLLREVPARVRTPGKDGLRLELREGDEDSVR